LLDIFGFLSVLLRAMTLAFEALTVGGVVFQFAIAMRDPEGTFDGRLSALLIGSSSLLAATQLGYVAATSAILMASTNLTWTQVTGASYCIAGALTIAGAGMVGLATSTRAAKFWCPIGCIPILVGAVMTSHSLARLEYRWALAALTLTHHLAGATWIGGMPYLLLTLKHGTDHARAAAIIRRFSQMAMASVAALISAGLAMSVLYIRSEAALIGTAYGVMVLSKVFLTGLVVMLGGLNRTVVSTLRAGITASLVRLRRFADHLDMASEIKAPPKPNSAATMAIIRNTTA
jgi:putative copper resistance protein D